jgi:hypothetical protein
MRYAISANNLAGPTVQQRIEDVRTFAGKTVTATFYVRASAGSTFTPNYIFMQQNFGSGGSSTVNTAPVQSLVALTSSWVKHTYTFNIPSIGSKTIGAGNYINIIFRIPDNTTTTVDFAQVQVEEGSIATPFEQRPIGVELALCQRYFHSLGGDTAYQSINTVVWYGSTDAAGFFRHPVQMRVAPTIGKTGDWTLLGSGGTVSQTINADQNGPKTTQFGFSGGSGGTSGQATLIRVNNDNNFRLTFSAEL